MAKIRVAPMAADLVCLAALCAVVLAWCAPALVHGAVFGSYDTALSAGLGRSLVSGVHDLVSGDQARQDAAWIHLDWVTVHAGALPLWNPFSDLGLPELANLQSSPASLPSLVSYLAPLSAAYTVSVVVKLAVGGAGCYFAARVLRTSRMSALLAGVVGELGGPMAAWAGWPQTGVAEWTGWIVGLVVLACRSPGWRPTVGLVCATAFACAGGFPEVLALLGVGAAVVFIVLIGFQVLSSIRGVADFDAPLGRQLLSVVTGVLGGVLVSAPVWLPAIPVLRRSVSSLRPAQGFLGARDLALFFDPSYFGLPSTTSVWFGPGRAGEYFETAAFVGPLVLSCALIGVVRRRRAPAVVALALAAVVVGAIAFGLPPIRELVLALPGLKTVAFGRGLLVVCDLLGILAAVGLHELSSGRPGRSGWSAYALFAGLTGVLAVLAATGGTLTGVERRERLDGYALAIAGILVLGVLLLAAQLWPCAPPAPADDTAAPGALPLPRRSRCRGARSYSARHLRVGLVVAAEATTLVLASAAVSTWSSVYLPRNSALRRYVGSAGGGLVALGGGHAPSQPPRLAIYPELNVAYEVRELAGYDAVTPIALYKLWEEVAPAPDLAAHELTGDVTQFAPDVQSVLQARRLGVSYIVEPLHGALRLVANATSCVSSALAAAGSRSPATVTGVVDDLEWLVEQPALLRAFPAHDPGYVVRYLAAEASRAPGFLATPTPDGAPGAAAVVSLAPHFPRLAVSLEACLTEAAAGGLVRVGVIGTEVLYRVPGPEGAYFSSTASGSVDSSLEYRSDASATVTVSASRSAWLTVTVDDEPGWSASTAAGTGLPARNRGALLEVRVPRGRHVIVIRYWPEDLTLGLALSLAAVLALAVALALVGWRSYGDIRSTRSRSAHATTTPNDLARRSRVRS